MINKRPIVIEQTNGNDREYDIYSRLLKERIIFLDEDVSSQSASVVIAQLLFLQMEDPNEDITMYINSPGGSINAGLAIVDTMNYISCDVSTVVIGTAASMGSVIASSGTKGKRYTRFTRQLPTYFITASMLQTVSAWLMRAIYTAA